MSAAIVETGHKQDKSDTKRLIKGSIGSFDPGLNCNSTGTTKIGSRDK